MLGNVKQTKHKSQHHHHHHQHLYRILRTENDAINASSVGKTNDTFIVCPEDSNDSEASEFINHFDW